MSATATDIIADEAYSAAPLKDSKWSGFFRGTTGRCGLIAYYAGLTKGMLAALIALAGVMVPYLAFFGEESNREMPLAIGVLMSVVMIVGLIAFILYFLRLTFRRLHDLDLSAWWSLVFLVPVISTIFSVYIGLVPGKVEDNRFGPWTRATSLDKVFGVIGIVITVLLLAASVWVTLNGYG